MAREAARQLVDLGEPLHHALGLAAQSLPRGLPCGLVAVVMMLRGPPSSPRHAKVVRCLLVAPDGPVGGVPQRLDRGHADATELLAAARRQQLNLHVRLEDGPRARAPAALEPRVARVVRLVILRVVRRVEGLADALPDREDGAVDERKLLEVQPLVDGRLPIRFPERLDVGRVLRPAERELERMNAQPVQVRWAAPSGEQLTLMLPSTVYPPREDTDLLLSALSRQLVNSKTIWLEIGCGSGVLSWWAAKQGCTVSACDVNPLAVACTRALLSEHGLVGNVFEGGPGPSVDGGLSQWGGDRLYDVVVWNMPYLSSDVLIRGALGPMEEAALTDTDASGLLSRFLTLLQDGRLLTRSGVAFLTVSSNGIGDEAEAIAWSHGLAGRTVATRTFDDGETLRVLAVWKPYSNASIERVESTLSTNDDVMNRGKAEGDTVLAAEQEGGRGRLGRRWETQPGAMMASWLTSQGRPVSHHTLDQLRVGDGLVRLMRVLSPLHQDATVLKWPNDLYILRAEGRLSKAGGVLFEATTCLLYTSPSPRDS